MYVINKTPLPEAHPAERASSSCITYTASYTRSRLVFLYPFPLQGAENKTIQKLQCLYLISGEALFIIQALESSVDFYPCPVYMCKTPHANEKANLTRKKKKTGNAEVGTADVLSTGFPTCRVLCTATATASNGG